MGEVGRGIFGGECQGVRRYIKYSGEIDRADAEICPHSIPLAWTGTSTLIQLTSFNSPHSTHLIQLTSFNSPHSTHLIQLTSFNSPHSTHLIQLTLQALSPPLLPSNFPQPQISRCGKAAMRNAATAAFLDAGSVSMRDIVCACAVGTRNGALVLDPTERNGRFWFPIPRNSARRAGVGRIGRGRRRLGKDRKKRATDGGGDGEGLYASAV
ncbi:hypothetical protein DACRYDRAFT_25639 [Dacryopinax primogenitus]|uniref:Uncharacterized protein n=1 Tax=Dacryopinax primogenitus (strain DJM 731) TaxID=1858805 RepID=M5FPQ3_DACPD|nr:uncharacterized protein DACRYDRAFT_25639 [Dacryopinax primogenitus]EJT96554.1 hypothetical protein DACRYDRAFT_25639 [Dacryopinax primogenitus]